MTWDGKTWPPPDIDELSLQEVCAVILRRLENLERQLEFFNGHVHRSTGSGKSTQSGPPVPRTW